MGNNRFHLELFLCLCGSLLQHLNEEKGTLIWIAVGDPSEWLIVSVVSIAFLYNMHTIKKRGQMVTGFLFLTNFCSDLWFTWQTIPSLESNWTICVHSTKCISSEQTVLRGLQILSRTSKQNTKGLNVRFRFESSFLVDNLTQHHNRHNYKQNNLFSLKDAKSLVDHFIWRCNSFSLHSMHLFFADLHWSYVSEKGNSWGCVILFDGRKGLKGFPKI